MRLDLYQLETARIAAEQGALLDQARAVLQQGLELRPLEEAGVLHALQVLIENAIGKAKLLIKQSQQTVPVSAYDAFAQLHRDHAIDDEAMRHWTAAIGLRNRIVHDYMNIDMAQVRAWVQAGKDHFVTQFLLEPFTIPNNTPP